MKRTSLNEKKKVVKILSAEDRPIHVIAKSMSERHRTGRSSKLKTPTKSP